MNKESTKANGWVYIFLKTYLRTSRSILPHASFSSALFPKHVWGNAKETCKNAEKPIPFLTVCISCTSSWSSRLALQKTLLFPSFIWAAKNGHFVTVGWIALWLAGGGWLAGSWELLLFCGVTSGEFLASWIEEKGIQEITSIHFDSFVYACGVVIRQYE